YGGRNLLLLTAILGAGAVLSLTRADQEVRYWYHSDMRSGSSDHFASMAKPFGDGMVMLPVYLGAFALKYMPTNKILQSVSLWGEYSLRMILVGAPPVLALQNGLGASRPTENDSHWRPFNDDNSVSGHAFMGAVPFLAAGKMVKARLLKTGFYVASTFTGWSRINDDKHYFSQAVMGWLMAVLSSKSVSCRENHTMALMVAPGKDRWTATISYNF
ncbi:MAG: PAP2 family protein, partial [Calditrichaeota bacterium]